MSANRLDVLGLSLGGLAALALLLTAFGVIGHFFIAVYIEAGDDQHEVIRNLGLVLAAIGGAPFVIWRSAVAAKQANTQAEALFNDKINAAGEDLAARRQVSWNIGLENGEEQVLTRWEDDLVTRAIAIDRLEGLARERTDEAPRIVRMLSVYVRELSKQPGGQAREHQRSDWLRLVERGMTEAEAADALKAKLEDVSREEFMKWARDLKPLRTDMEKAVQTICRLHELIGDDRVDLRDANLQGTYLSGFHFKRFLFTGVRFEGANLTEAHLEGAILSEAHLEGANLTEAHLEDADLRRASLDSAVLVKAHVDRANLTDACLVKANLSKAHLGQVTFTRAHLEGANLQEALLIGRAYLEEAHLEDADLRRANLHGANLVQAHLKRANLEGASLKLAYLGEVHLEKASLKFAIVEGAEFDRTHLEGTSLRGARAKGAEFRCISVDASTDFTDTDLQYAMVYSVDLSMVSLMQEQVDSVFGDSTVTFSGDITPPQWFSHRLGRSGHHGSWLTWQREQGYTPPT